VRADPHRARPAAGPPLPGLAEAVDPPGVAAADAQAGPLPPAEGRRGSPRIHSAKAGLPARRGRHHRAPRPRSGRAVLGDLGPPARSGGGQPGWGSAASEAHPLTVQPEHPAADIVDLQGPVKGQPGPFGWLRRRLELDRVDLLLMAAFLLVAFVIRSFSPIM